MHYELHVSRGSRSCRHQSFVCTQASRPRTCVCAQASCVLMPCFHVHREWALPLPAARLLKAFQGCGRSALRIDKPISPLPPCSGVLCPPGHWRLWPLCDSDPECVITAAHSSVGATGIRPGPSLVPFQPFVPPGRCFGALGSNRALVGDAAQSFPLRVLFWPPLAAVGPSLGPDSWRSSVCDCAAGAGSHCCCARCCDDLREPVCFLRQPRGALQWQPATQQVDRARGAVFSQWAAADAFLQVLTGLITSLSSLLFAPAGGKLHLHQCRVGCAAAHMLASWQQPFFRAVGVLHKPD
jgi:hypothetical protein